MKKRTVYYFADEAWSNLNSAMVEVQELRRKHKGPITEGIGLDYCVVLEKLEACEKNLNMLLPEGIVKARKGKTLIDCLLADDDV